MEILKLKGSNNYYVSLGNGDDPSLVEISQILLTGCIEESFFVDKNDLELISEPPAVWKAAFLVWKNSEMLANAHNEQENSNKKYKKKLIELLAIKHNLNKESVFSLIEELEEITLN
jgi:hypothetical protein